MQKDGKRWPIGADYGTGCGVKCPETIAETKGCSGSAYSAHTPTTGAGSPAMTKQSKHRSAWPICRSSSLGSERPSANSVSACRVPNVRSRKIATTGAIAPTDSSRHCLDLASTENPDTDEEKIMPVQMNAELFCKLQELSRHNAVARALVFLWETGPLTDEDWATKAISLLIDQNETLSAIAVDAEKRACRLPKTPSVASPTR